MEFKIEKNTQKIIISILIIVIAISAYFIISNMHPTKYISNINNYFNLKQYEEVAKYENKLKSILNYLLSKGEYDEYKSIEYKVNYSVALTLFKNNDYYSALKTFESISSQRPRRFNGYEYRY